MVSTPSDPDSPSSPPSSPLHSCPSTLSPTPLTSTPFASFDDDFTPLPSFHSISSSSLKSRRKTWHKADIQIGDRLLSPMRGVGEERETVTGQALMFSSVTEADVEDSVMEDTATLPPPIPPTPAPLVPQLPPAVPAQSFVSTRRPRPSIRPSTRLSVSRRQTLTPVVPPTPPSGRRPLRPTSLAPAPKGGKSRFDVAASLAKPVTWRMHKGPIGSEVGNPNGRGYKVREGGNEGVGVKEGKEMQRRRQSRQKSVDYRRLSAVKERHSTAENQSSH